MQNARVVQIFIAPKAGEPMREVKEVQMIAGVGLEGDRYALDLGAFSKAKRKAIRHVTLISLDGINQANAELTAPFLVAETRRNIVLDGISAEELNNFVGKEFGIGDARVRGVELCDPCKRPSALSGTSGFEIAFKNRGGLRIEIISSGKIKVGDILS